MSVRKSSEADGGRGRNETALRVLNLLFVLNSSSNPLTTEQIVSDSDLGYGSDNRASDLKKFKRDRDRLAEHGIHVVEVRDEGATATDGSRWTIDRASTYAPAGVISRDDADTLLRAVDESLSRQEIPYRQALLGIRSKLVALTQGPGSGTDAGEARREDGTDRCDGDDGGAGRCADALWSAFAMKRRIRFAYLDARGAESQRTLEIWGVFVQDGHTYYVGLDEQSGGVRTFRADRVTRCWRPAGSYTVPPWFDVRDYLFLPFDIAGGLASKACFTFDGSIGEDEVVAITHGRGELEHLVDGRRLWTVKVRDMRAAAAFALSHAQASVRPFSPQKLVDEWNSLIGKAVAAHAEA